MLHQAAMKFISFIVSGITWNSHIAVVLPLQIICVALIDRAISHSSLTELRPLQTPRSTLLPFQSLDAAQ